GDTGNEQPPIRHCRCRPARHRHLRLAIAGDPATGRPAAAQSDRPWPASGRHPDPGQGDRQPADPAGRPDQLPGGDQLAELSSGRTKAEHRLGTGAGPGQPGHRDGARQSVAGPRSPQRSPRSVDAGSATGCSAESPGFARGTYWCPADNRRGATGRTARRGRAVAGADPAAAADDRCQGPGSRPERQRSLSRSTPAGRPGRYASWRSQGRAAAPGSPAPRAAWQHTAGHRPGRSQLRPGPARLRPQCARRTRTDQRRPAGTGLSLAEPAAAEHGWRSRPGHDPETGRRRDLAPANPPVVQPRTDANQPRRHPAHHLATRTADARPARYRAAADQTATRTGHQARADGKTGNAMAGRTGLRHGTSRPAAVAGPAAARLAVQPDMGRPRRNRAADSRRARSPAPASDSRRPHRPRVDLPPGPAAARPTYHHRPTLRDRNPSGNSSPRQAIALSYDGSNAPSLTAKGDDELAEAILAIAREHEVPIYENAELVRLLARLELGDAIPEALYRTIAEIIAFAWYLKGKY